MALEARHIENIDLFLNAKRMLGVEAENASGDVMRFKSRSEFLDHIMEFEDVGKTTKQSLTGILAYRILTNKDFYGHKLRLFKREDSAIRGNLGRHISQRRGSGGKTNNTYRPKRRKRTAYLVNVDTKEVLSFNNRNVYRGYASEHGLSQAFIWQTFKGAKRVGEGYYLCSENYYEKYLTKKYYWVRNSSGKFEKGFSSFSELVSHLGEDANVVRAELHKKKKIVSRSRIDYSLLKKRTEEVS